MEDILFRFAIVWILLHIILFFVELVRYKDSTWNWPGFLSNGMLFITYLICAFDIIVILLAIIGGLLYWIVQPEIL